MPTMSSSAHAPGIDLSTAAFVHPSAVMYGKIRISAGVTIWPNVVMRAEMHGIDIGEQTNIQDFVMIHIGATTPTIIGRDCSITHHCTLHGCKIGDRVLVGIGATLMDGVEVGDNSIIAGGSFLKEGTIIPPNSIVMGSPGKVSKERNNAVAMPGSTVKTAWPSRAAIMNTWARRNFMPP